MDDDGRVHAQLQKDPPAQSVCCVRRDNFVARVGVRDYLILMRLFSSVRVDFCVRALV